MSVETSTTYNEAQQAWHCLWCHAPLGENEHCRKPACEARQRTADTRMGRRSTPEDNESCAQSFGL